MWVWIWYIGNVSAKGVEAFQELISKLVDDNNN